MISLNSVLVDLESILFTISHQIKNISILLSPIIPEASNKVFKIMNLSLNDLKVDKINDMKTYISLDRFMKFY